MGNETLSVLYEQLVSAEGSDNFLVRTLVLISVITVVGRFAYQSLTAQDDVSKLPIINGSKPWSFSETAEKLNFKQNAGALIEQGFKTVGKAFQLQTDNGIHLVLSAEYADSIKNSPHLSFLELTAHDFHAGIPGFNAWTQVTCGDEVILTTVKENLTHRHTMLYEPISKEVAHVLRTDWTDNAEWHDLPVRETVVKIISRASSRAFLGAKLCRDPNWVNYILSYIANSYKAAEDLRKWPRLLRPIAHWFIPSCGDLRTDFANCCSVVLPEAERRRRDKKARIAQGLEPEQHDDCIEWFDQVAKGRKYDATGAQIVVAIAGIFSSVDTLTQVVYNLCDQPQLVEDLRKELISVMSGNQWSKKNLSQLQLMDSVMKETQRLKPIAIASMHRMATGDIVLDDGTKIPKGTKLMVSAHHSWDNSIYPDAMKFDGYRFLRLREEGLTTAQFATTSSSTIGFGHGHLACPGRFFASDEIKIALSHILLEYDFKLAAETQPEIITSGFLYCANLSELIKVRRRKEEIHL